MKPKILTKPKMMLGVLRRYFNGRGIDSFDRDEPTFFGFVANFAGSSILIHTEIQPPPWRVLTETTIIGEAKPSLAKCRELLAELNSNTTVARVGMNDESEFCIQTALLLGEGCCLESQLTALGRHHMATMDEMVPLLGKFARGKSTLRDCHRQIASAVALSDAQRATTNLDTDSN